MDYSSSCSTILPSRLVSKLMDQGLNAALCDWILDLLTGCHQMVKVHIRTLPTWTFSTGAPQGCVLSPLLYFLYTHDCVAAKSRNTIVKFEDDVAVVGLISCSDEMTYREEVTDLEQWCQDNHLLLNVSETIVDCRRKGATRSPIVIDGTVVEKGGQFQISLS